MKHAKRHIVQFRLFREKRGGVDDQLWTHTPLPLHFSLKLLGFPRVHYISFAGFLICEFNYFSSTAMETFFFFEGFLILL